MSNSLEVIPLDIMLEIANELDLMDSVHLLSTCSTFRSLLSSRNFWIKALHKIKYDSKQPLPCGDSIDISSLPLETLREMAERVHKLDKRWSRESISPVSVRRFAAGRNILSIRVIPGTDLILTVTSERRVCCFDAHFGEMLDSIDFPEAEPASLTLGPCPLELPGQSMIPVACMYPSNGTVELSALRLDFRNREDVTIRKDFSKIWRSPDKFLDNITIDGHMVAGVLQGDYRSSWDASLVYFRFDEDILHSIPLGSHQESTAPSCILHQEYIYLTRHYFDGLAEIIRFGSEGSLSSPAPASPGFSRMEIDLAQLPQEYSGSVSLGPCHMRVPIYGILNVATRGATDDNLNTEFVHFWPVDTTPSSFEVYQHPCEVPKIFVGSAGTSAVIWDIERKATLLRYFAHPTPHITAHRLYLSAPDLDLDTDDVPTFELDDRRGVLYVRAPDPTDEGLSIFSYT
ncbi:hypothetical protein FB451DRAFT_1239062 [Mycena latifolia]|nr:hypothetical protein FB451DRAFT_1239062 [Mycena latifolia]